VAKFTQETPKKKTPLTSHQRWAHLVNIPQNIGPNENYINFSLCLFLRGRAKQVNQPLILSSINNQDQEASLLERVLVQSVQRWIMKLKRFEITFFL
jgi:hypothetical protein